MTWLADAELGRILDTHPELPPIARTAGPVRAVSGAWRTAPALADHREQPGSGGTAFLHAAARRAGVKVRITATVSGGEGDDVTVTW